MNNINQILSEFTPITLKEMDAVALLNRNDRKYFFMRSQLPELLTLLKDHYSVLTINNNRLSHYETIYFDTNDFKLFNLHQKGKPNRYKLRSRKYTESNLSFFEIKFKTNKGRTLKERIKTDTLISDITSINDFINVYPRIKKADYLPQINVKYYRITLVSNTNKERMTIDIDLSFETKSLNKHFSNLVIAEIKRDKSNNDSLASDVLKKLRIKPRSISKYCLGVMSCIENIKINNFKQNLKNINTINYAA